MKTMAVEIRSSLARNIIFSIVVVSLLTVKCRFSRLRLRHFISVTKIHLWWISVFQRTLETNLNLYFHQVASVSIRRFLPALNAAFSKWPPSHFYRDKLQKRLLQIWFRNMIIFPDTTIIQYQFLGHCHSFFFIWIIRFRIRLKWKWYPFQIQKILNIRPDWTPKTGSCTPLLGMHFELWLRSKAAWCKKLPGWTYFYKLKVNTGNVLCCFIIHSGESIFVWGRYFFKA